MNKLLNISKIAVLRANALGDLMFALPALYSLRQTYKSAKIYYLGKKWHKNFFINHPGIVDHSITIPISRGVREENNRLEIKSKLDVFFKRMQKIKFDLAIQIHGGGKHSNPFVKELGAKITAGLKSPNARELDINIPYKYYQHEYHRYLEVVFALGCPYFFKTPLITASYEELKQASIYLPQKPFITIHIGATDVRRRWPIEKYAKVINQLSNTNYPIVLTGSKDEVRLTKKLKKLITNKNVIDISGKLTLTALSGILAKTVLLISNDTGPLHLATAFNTKTIGLYWCGNMINASQFTRKTNHPLISWVINCPLCNQNITKIFPFKPKSRICKHKVSFIDDIKVNEVLEAINQLLP
jgi:ADP-heptose:LPS heptosyltransferase